MAFACGGVTRAQSSCGSSARPQVSSRTPGTIVWKPSTAGCGSAHVVLTRTAKSGSCERTAAAQESLRVQAGHVSPCLGPRSSSCRATQRLEASSGRSPQRLGRRSTRPRAGSGWQRCCQQVVILPAAMIIRRGIGATGLAAKAWSHWVARDARRGARVTFQLRHRCCVAGAGR